MALLGFYHFSSLFTSPVTRSAWRQAMLEREWICRGTREDRSTINLGHVRVQTLATWVTGECFIHCDMPLRRVSKSCDCNKWLDHERSTFCFFLWEKLKSRARRLFYFILLMILKDGGCSRLGNDGDTRLKNFVWRKVLFSSRKISVKVSLRQIKIWKF